MKCRVCKMPVTPQYQQNGWYGGTVAAPHPAKSGKGICDGSGRPEKKR